MKTTTFPTLWVETLKALGGEIHENGDHRGFADTDWNPRWHVQITLTVQECRNILEMLKVMQSVNARIPKSKR